MLIYGVDHFTYKMSSILSMVSKKTNLDKNQNPNPEFLPKCTKIVKSDKTVYGINTGFGPLCDVKNFRRRNRTVTRESYHFAFCRSRKTNC